MGFPAYPNIPSTHVRLVTCSATCPPIGGSERCVCVLGGVVKTNTESSVVSGVFMVTHFVCVFVCVCGFSMC